jgi:hypothetical protein
VFSSGPAGLLYRRGWGWARAGGDGAMRVAACVTHTRACALGGRPAHAPPFFVCFPTRALALVFFFLLFCPVRFAGASTERQLSHTTPSAKRGHFFFPRAPSAPRTCIAHARTRSPHVQAQPHDHKPHARAPAPPPARTDGALGRARRVCVGRRPRIPQNSLARLRARPGPAARADTDRDVCGAVVSVCVWDCACGGGHGLCAVSPT